MATLNISELPLESWQHLSIDFCGPVPTGEHLLVITDEFLRNRVVEIVNSVSAKTTIPVVDKLLSTFGYPEDMKSDYGSPFNSTAFEELAEHRGFKHRKITPHCPRANAQAESFNTPLMKAEQYEVQKATRRSGNKNYTSSFDNIVQHHIRRQGSFRCN